MSRRRDTICLSKPQRLLISQFLEERARKPQQINRAQVLICWNEGLTGAETASRLGISPDSVYCLRRDFKRKTLADYLNVSVQGGAPTKLTPTVRKKLAKILAQPPSKGLSSRRLAADLVRKGLISSMSVHTVAKGLSTLRQTD